MKIDYATLKRLEVLSHYVSGEYVLDVGCRGGEMGKLLKPKTKYFGLDVGPASKSNPRVNYLSKGITDPNIKNLYRKQKFDTIILAETLEHFSNPQLALENIYFLLKKGGKLVGSVPNGVGWRYFFFLELLGDGMFDFSKPKWDGSEHFFTFNKYVIRTLLMYSKYKISFIKEWGNWIPHTSIFLPFNIRGSHIVFVAEK